MLLRLYDKEMEEARPSSERYTSRIRRDDHRESSEGTRMIAD
jgi:hypothetical protein